MPYLSPNDRASVRDNGPMTPGGLNYAITRLCIEYINWASDKTPGTPTYAQRAEVYGSILAAAEEWYRRVLAPYEDAKCKQHGDVYPFWLTEGHDGY